jgi:ureidoglycolate lyase
MEGRDCFSINGGRADRYDAVAEVDCEGSGKVPVISLIHSRKYDFPKSVTFLERHPFGSQAFIPTSETPFVVVVGAPGPQVDTSTLRAFISNGRQGINYHRHTWHHVMLTPFDDVSFIVVDRSDPGTNCEEHWFAECEQPLLDGSGVVKL